MNGVAWPEQQPTLRDDVLTLRPWTAADADQVFLACQDEGIQRYTMVPVPYLREHAEDFVAVASAARFQQRLGAEFAVTDAVTDELLGACGLTSVELTARSAEAGYWVAPWARGRGVATGALTILASWALGLQELGRLQLHIEPENAASVAVATRAGFVQMPSARLLKEHRGQTRRFQLFELTPQEP